MLNCEMADEIEKINYFAKNDVVKEGLGYNYQDVIMKEPFDLGHDYLVDEPTFALSQGAEMTINFVLNNSNIIFSQTITDADIMAGKKEGSIQIELSDIERSSDQLEWETFITAPEYLNFVEDKVHGTFKKKEERRSERHGNRLEATQNADGTFEI